ncbi:ketose-bisphosphate aldolase [Microbacterium betulae]|uniref:Ketose-bisphosphate aldolase n=1 Tax=Microbacterium betulae TaxID=2981139 RepID=A0AA97FFQ0_9MICO|nr:ketose-bisphosphate aldolase [Microbacterium sp. AB]WOF22063.1 ketose-bisphosphate aldolase [Microbacterium sp. AB]
MLVSGKDLLDVASANDFAIPAFNVADYHMFNGLVEVSEDRGAPLIVAIHPNEIDLLGFDVIHAIRNRLHRSPIPATIHWDHGASHEQMVAAIQGGFTSVMLDASAEPFERNVAWTRRAVETAHAVGVSVEGELGTIGKMESADGGIVYTDPEDAVAFVRETGVDSLAIAIGTRHGIYPADITPQLRLDLLREIKAAVGIPLVLHGGSNNPDDEVGEAARSGVNKINISSDIKVAYHEALRGVLEDRGLREPDAIVPPAIEALKAVAAQKIDLFGAAGKAALYRPLPARKADLFTSGQTATA